jgi:hypothetical protein
MVGTAGSFGAPGNRLHRKLNFSNATMDGFTTRAFRGGAWRFLEAVFSRRPVGPTRVLESISLKFLTKPKVAASAVECQSVPIERHLDTVEVWGSSPISANLKEPSCR